MVMEFTAVQLREQLDGDRNKLLAELLGGHQGVFRIKGGGTFKLEYVTEGPLTQLAVRRQHDRGACWLQKARCRAVDLWGGSGQRKLQQAFRHIGGIADQIARDLKHESGAVFHRLCPDGSVAAMLESLGIASPAPEILAWSAKRAPYSPIALRQLDPHRTRLDGDRLVLSFRHHDDTIQLVFTAQRGEQGARALARLHALATGTGHHAERFGGYADLRQLMAQFVRASVEEEAPAELARIARARLLRETPTAFHLKCVDQRSHQRGDQHVDQRVDQRGYLYAPIYRSDTAIANQSAAAIDLAVRRVLPELSACAALRADGILHDDARWPANARPIVEKYADIAIEQAHAAARTQLAGHSPKAFRRRVEQQAGATPEECASLKARGKRWGNLGAMPVPGQVPKYAASVGSPEGCPPGMVTMYFQQKVSLMKKLWLNLTHPRARVHAADSNARQVLHAGETRYLRQAASGDLVKRHAVMLRANPEALRFCIGANVRIAKSNLADIAATKTYLGLSQLYEQLHATVYDNHMHTAVVPAVRQAVDDAVRAMRRERRETLAGQLARDPMLQPVAAMLGKDRHAEFVAAAVAERMAFLEARDAADVLGRATAHARAAEASLAAIAPPALPTLAMTRARDQAVAAAEAAQHASRRAGETLLQARQALCLAVGRVDGGAVVVLLDALEDKERPASTSPTVALADALQPLIAEVDAEHERLGADEAALRQRLDTMRIGKATLGEFNAWTRAEVEHFSAGGHHPGHRVADQAANREPGAVQPAAQPAARPDAESAAQPDARADTQPNAQPDSQPDSQPAAQAPDVPQDGPTDAVAQPMADPAADRPARADIRAASQADIVAGMPALQRPVSAGAASEPDTASRHGARLARSETPEQVAYWMYLAALGGESVEPDPSWLDDGIEALNVMVLDTNGRPQSLGTLGPASIDEGADGGPPAELLHDGNRNGISITVERLV